MTAQHIVANPHDLQQRAFDDVAYTAYVSHHDEVPEAYLLAYQDFRLDSTAELLQQFAADKTDETDTWRSLMVAETIMDRLLYRIYLSVEVLSPGSIVKVPPVMYAGECHRHDAIYDTTVFARLLQAMVEDAATQLVGHTVPKGVSTEVGMRRVVKNIHHLIEEESTVRHIDPMLRVAYRDLFRPDNPDTRRTSTTISHQHFLRQDMAALLISPGAHQDHAQQVEDYVKQRFRQWNRNYRKLGVNTIPIHQFLHHAGVLEPYFSLLFTRLIQVVDTTQRNVYFRFWWLNAVLASVVFDATLAVERLHDTKNIPIRWMIPLIIQQLPSATDFVDMLFSTEDMLWQPVSSQPRLS